MNRLTSPAVRGCSTFPLQPRTGKGARPCSVLLFDPSSRIPFLRHSITLPESPSLAMAQKGSRVLVKNKSAAAVQITAEQLMREAWERQDEEAPRVPTQRIADADELKVPPTPAPSP